MTDKYWIKPNGEIIEAPEGHLRHIQRKWVEYGFPEIVSPTDLVNQGWVRVSGDTVIMSDVDNPTVFEHLRYVLIANGYSKYDIFVDGNAHAITLKEIVENSFEDIYMDTLTEEHKVTADAYDQGIFEQQPSYQESLDSGSTGVRDKGTQFMPQDFQKEVWWNRQLLDYLKKNFPGKKDVLPPEPDNGYPTYSWQVVDRMKKKAEEESVVNKNIKTTEIPSPEQTDYPWILAYDVVIMTGENSISRLVISIINGDDGNLIENVWDEIIEGTDWENSPEYQDGLKRYEKFLDAIDNYAKRVCVECGKVEYLDESALTDIALCDDCIPKFNLDELWEMHDANQIDALDFNESQEFRERFRIGASPVNIEQWEQRWRKKGSLQKNADLIDTDKVLVFDWYRKDLLEDMVEESLTQEQWTNFLQWVYDTKSMPSITDTVLDFYDEWKKAQSGNVEDWEQRWRRQGSLRKKAQDDMDKVYRWNVFDHQTGGNISSGEGDTLEESVEGMVSYLLGSGEHEEMEEIVPTMTLEEKKRWVEEFEFSFDENPDIIDKEQKTRVWEQRWKKKGSLKKHAGVTEEECIHCERSGRYDHEDDESGLGDMTLCTGGYLHWGCFDEYMKQRDEGVNTPKTWDWEQRWRRRGSLKKKSYNLQNIDGPAIEEYPEGFVKEWFERAFRPVESDPGYFKDWESKFLRYDHKVWRLMDTDRRREYLKLLKEKDLIQDPEAWEQRWRKQSSMSRTGVSLEQWFEARYGIKPEQNPVYFNIWKKRDEEGTIGQNMDAQGDEIYKRLLREEIIEKNKGIEDILRREGSIQVKADKYSSIKKVVESDRPRRFRQGSWLYERDSDGILHVTYWSTEVVTADANTKKILNVTTGGYNTMSTKKGIGEVLWALKKHGFDYPRMIGYEYNAEKGTPQEELDLMDSWDDNTSPERLAELAKHSDSKIRANVARNSATPVEVLLELLNDKNAWVRYAVINNYEAPREIFEAVLKSPNEKLRARMAENHWGKVPKDIMDALSNDESELVKFTLIKSDSTPGETLEKFLDSDDLNILGYLAKSRHATENILRTLSTHEDNSIRMMVAKRGSIPLDVQQTLARDPVAGVKLSLLSGWNDIDLGILRILARDPDASVVEEAKRKASRQGIDIEKDTAEEWEQRWRKKT